MSVARASATAAAPFPDRDSLAAILGKSASGAPEITVPAAPPGASPNGLPHPPKPAFVAAAPMPTQEGPTGIRFDFNDGCRVVLDDSRGPCRLRLSDIDTGNVLFETTLKSAGVNSTKRFFVRFRIEIWTADGKELFSHDYSAAGRNVLVQLPVGTLGDTLGWFPYAARFQEVHGCKLTVAMAEWMIPLFQDAYPQIRFVHSDQIVPSEYYASYNIGLFFDDRDSIWQPSDFRLVGLHRTAAYILGVDPTEAAARLSLADESRPVPEKYVCIAAQASTQAKYWNNPTGWRDVIAFLKNNGYRVICIDQRPVHGQGIVWNHIPYGAEDETGDRPLQERARWLRHAEFFIGLSSGLAWLAWAAGTPVIMISGFTHPLNEFQTPYRIVNYHACNSCWNDPAHRFDHTDFLWCPRHKNTPRQFECTRLITSDQVKAMIRRIPGFTEIATPPAG